MSTVIDLPVESTRRTFGDILRDLGDIDADRIRWRPYPGTATVDDVIRIHDDEGRLCELVDGILVEKAMGLKESCLAQDIAFEIKLFIRQKKLGVVAGADGTMQLFPDLVRIPDVSYFTWDRLKGKIPEEQAPLLSPDLAIEVISPGNKKREMDRKCEEYFKSGAQAVWYFYPLSKTAVVYRSPEVSRIFTENETIPGEPALPGFVLNLKSLFANADLKPAQ